MSQPIDLEQVRNKKKGEEIQNNGFYYCSDCGSASFRLFVNGIVECFNCTTQVGGLQTVEIDSQQ